jgi:aspartate racemase
LKTAGLIGGLSWEATHLYYRLLNEAVRERLGGFHSAKCLIYSFNFSEIEGLLRQGKWGEVAGKMISAGRALEKAGADFLTIACNSMHRVAEEVEASSGVPFLHIGDAAGEALIQQGVKSVGLLGTQFTMEEKFLQDRLANRFGLEVIVPNAQDRVEIHRIILSELCLGKVLPSSKKTLFSVIDSLRRQNVHGVLLGCTELSLLLPPKESDFPLFDTAEIHVKAMVQALFANPGT